MDFQLMISTLMIFLFIPNTFSQRSPPCFIQENNVLNDLDASSQDYHLEDSIATFGLDLFRNVAVNYPNSVLMSPYGVWRVLLLAYYGSEGNTKNELATALGLKGNKLQILNDANLINSKIHNNAGKESAPIVTSKDTAYFTSEIALKPCITNLIPDLQSLDFTNVTNASKRINDDVSRNTRGKITNVITPNQLVGVRFILTNAIYFEGKWKTKFNKAIPMRWFSDEQKNNISYVSMMTLKGLKFKYVASHTLGARMLEVPYLGDDISLYLILPYENIDNVLPLLNSSTLDKAISLMRKTTVDLGIPKFKLESTISDILKQVLEQQGIKDVFSRNSDFTSFTESEDLFANSVNQKSVVEFDEEGTIAAAFTSLIMVQSINFNFECNRPFAFLIRHNPTKSILFAGVIKNPGDLEVIV